MFIGALALLQFSYKSVFNDNILMYPYASNGDIFLWAVDKLQYRFVL